MNEYQPIVKNLRNMALRNRNLLATEKVMMPRLNSEKLYERAPGMTSAPFSPQTPGSPQRLQFFNEFLLEEKPEVETDGEEDGKVEAAPTKIRNMVHANKLERC